MKIVTWNVNSIRAREDIVLDWVEANAPDVLCLQETKITDQEFPEDGFVDMGYEVSFYGQASYNGVAIASRRGLGPIRKGFDEGDEEEEKRLLITEVEGTTIVDIYLPNGKSYGGDKFRYKLGWIDQLHRMLQERLSKTERLVLCGDFNIAPLDLDHYWAPDGTPRLFTSPEERAALKKLTDLGLVDVHPKVRPNERAYTWWDYRGRGFQRDEGMRIDLFLVTPQVLQEVSDIQVDRETRSGEGPSDHAPVILELESP
ncbi:MAG: exodeoxyribonuclease III [Myxococcota bacterium]